MESLTLIKYLEKRILGFKKIATATHTPNVKIQERAGKCETLLEVINKRKVRWFGHVVRAKGTLAYTILQGKVDGEIMR